MGKLIGGFAQYNIVGCTAKDVMGSGDVASCEAWQKKRVLTGTAATWLPGKTTWGVLRVPKS
ncbi:hypothetical protein ACFV2X_14920 [Streptomyces sp. NPDC059679]|uniref:hypothetical protein n=1 Tax=Streptomyces sp. NPDC059679 TaxID=3346903 RepID=UPI0036B21F38